MYAQRNIEALARNHFCRGKVISITYFHACVCVCACVRARAHGHTWVNKCVCVRVGGCGCTGANMCFRACRLTCPACNAHAPY